MTARDTAIVRATLEAAAKVSEACKTGVAVEIDGCTYPLGVMSSRGSDAQLITATGIAAAIRSLDPSTVSLEGLSFAAPALAGEETRPPVPAAEAAEGETPETDAVIETDCVGDDFSPLKEHARSLERALTATLAKLAEVTSDRDSWARQADERAKDAARFIAERDEATAKLAEAEKDLAAVQFERQRDVLSRHEALDETVRLRKRVDDLEREAMYVGYYVRPADDPHYISPEEERQQEWRALLDRALAAERQAESAQSSRDAMERERDEAREDADRWATFCNLWAASTVLEATQDEDGGWYIRQIEPAEDITFSPISGDTPEEAIDHARSQGAEKEGKS